MNVNIAHVSIKKSDTNFDLVTLHQFLKLPLTDRHEMIKSHKVEFIDSQGEKIKLIEGLKAITDLIKQLREEGRYSTYIAQGS